MKNILIYFSFVLFTCQSCKNSNNETTTTYELKLSGPSNLLDCNHSKFKILFSELKKYLASQYPNCSSFQVSYRKITSEQLDNNLQQFISISKNPYLRSIDSTFNINNILYFDLGIYNNTKPYEKSNPCSFYTNGIYYSDDYSIQFIRLFQEGKDEYFDLFIKIIEGKVNVIAFG